MAILKEIIMKFLKDQRGFTGLEIILLVVVIGGIGFVGYRAYQASSKQPEPITREAVTAKEDAKPPAKEPVQAPSDDAVTLTAAKKFCLANGGSPCNTSMDKRKANVASVKTESMLVLVAKDSSNQWQGILGNDSDSDICMTGTNAPQLRELCS